MTSRCANNWKAARSKDGAWPSAWRGVFRQGFIGGARDAAPPGRRPAGRDREGFLLTKCAVKSEFQITWALAVGALRSLEGSLSWIEAEKIFPPLITKDAALWRPDGACSSHPLRPARGLRSLPQALTTAAPAPFRWRRIGAFLSESRKHGVRKPHLRKLERGYGKTNLALR